jgi:hypothetical protein
MPHELNSSSSTSKGPPTIRTKGKTLPPTLPAEAAAARAKSRFNIRCDGSHLLTYEKGGMHHHYLDVLDDKDRQQLISDTENDVFDAVRNLYLIQSGGSLMY